MLTCGFKVAVLDFAMGSLVSVATEKLELRQTMLAKREAMSPQSVALASEQIVRNLLQDLGMRKASEVALYASFRQEVETWALLDALLSQGKQVYFPRMAHDEKLVFVPIEKREQLKPGRFSVLEPDPALPAVLLEKLDLIVVPGLAFDPRGGRLGLGKGYYDRVLKDFQGQSVGLAYDFQVLSHLPLEAWDKSVDRVFTELSVYQK